MVKHPPPIPIFEPHQDEVSCCGSSLAPPAGQHERAGYTICRFVDDFIETDSGPVPRVATRLSLYDKAGSIMVRLGARRDSYRIAPGLYCVGNPRHDSPVLATANYKLTFDTVRRELAGRDVWILVLDTRGINVWCASAHKTFGTDELIRMIGTSGLEKVVSHRQLVVPQLGASGVNAPALRKACGFEVVWGPLRASELPRFLAASCRADPAMRKLSFKMAERLVLAPVELTMALKPSLFILAAMFFVSGLGPEFFSLKQAWARWQFFASAFLSGLFAGTIIVPALLPWLPFRSFYLKGIVVALPVAVAIVFGGGTGFSTETIAQMLICLSVSSYAAMNFTGATPFASPSGVEKEMRRAIPLQAGMVLGALALLLVQPFLR